ncbi:putative Zinc finger protein [Quillaja saponaria]|uniref:Zinc finger protein n=1 Tax=Quillaja saponaria TaxID=32244 RepID=A0AAD7LAJ0_QUISA|nr:putative Zinc finger protein [Quillaja saponaria]
MAASSSSAPLFGIREEDQNQMNQQHPSTPSSSIAPAGPPTEPKRKRNQPGKSYPDAEVIALSPNSLMATNRFICEVCNKGFQREQNLQLHRRGHNLPWKLKQKSTKEPKRKVYLCPEPTCAHHDPCRALGDLTGIKKHYSRKHGEKKWKCIKCSKSYAVQSDWKAHSKTCGTREYKCDCGTLFSRRDSFITHRAFCDALAQESTRQPSTLGSTIRRHLYGNSSNMGLGLSQVGPKISMHDLNNQSSQHDILHLGGGRGNGKSGIGYSLLPPSTSPSPSQSINGGDFAFRPQHQSMPSSAFFTIPTESNPNYYHEAHQQSSSTLFSAVSNSVIGGSNHKISSSLYSNTSTFQNSYTNPHMSATALLEKAAQMGSTNSTNNTTASLLRSFGSSSSSSINISNSDRPNNNIFQAYANYNNTGNKNKNLQDLMDSFTTGNFENAYDVGHMEDPKLTRDFLGQIVRTMSSGGGKGGRGGEGGGGVEQQQQHGYGINE